MQKKRKNSLEAIGKPYRPIKSKAHCLAFEEHHKVLQQHAFDASPGSTGCR
jgi:hypothetical protein